MAKVKKKMKITKSKCLAMNLSQEHIKEMLQKEVCFIEMTVTSNNCGNFLSVDVSGQLEIVTTGKKHDFLTNVHLYQNSNSDWCPRSINIYINMNGKVGPEAEMNSSFIEFNKNTVKAIQSGCIEKRKNIRTTVQTTQTMQDIARQKTRNNTFLKIRLVVYVILLSITAIFPFIFEGRSVYIDHGNHSMSLGIGFISGGGHGYNTNSLFIPAFLFFLFLFIVMCADLSTAGIGKAFNGKTNY